MASLHKPKESCVTIYFVALRGKLYANHDANVPLVVKGTPQDGVALFYGRSAQAAAGAFALIKARCEIPSVNPDNEMRLFDQVLKEMDNAGT
jgi:hypothetical protein